ncbi:MAG: ABC transporter permease [Chloroflexi bacterium]|nr:MAG: ABC transporter permease [Chloroflexota bacterium]
MNEFLGVFRYEYRMSTRRWSLWITFGILTALYVTSVFMPPDLAEKSPTENEVMAYAGTMSFMLNLFMPVIGGILVADRLVRDQKLGVDELLRSTSLRRSTYLAGKYFGAVASITTPVLLCSLLLGVSAVAAGAPLTVLPAMLLGFLGVNLPAYMLITAFSLACPLVMPLRVYQVLFTGYWFWGNFLSPTVMPTTNGTYLVANGEYVMTAFFGGFFGGGGPDSQPIPSEIGAAINLAVLAALALLALIAADRYLARRANRA